MVIDKDGTTNLADPWRLVKLNYGLARDGDAGAKLKVKEFLHQLHPENSCDIFVSYRCTGGLAFARTLQLELKCRGYNVFFDYNSLRSGKFDDEILKAIDVCKCFVLILSEGCMDRCLEEDDWVRAEITHALKNGKRIIPMKKNDSPFAFPNALPDEIASIVNIPIVEWNPNSDLVKNRIDEEFFKSCKDDVPAILLNGTLDSSTEGLVGDYTHPGESFDNCVFRVFVEMIDREMDGGFHSDIKSMWAGDLFGD